MGCIPVDNSRLRFTPQAPLNHSGVCLCDLMFGQVQVQVFSGGFLSFNSLLKDSFKYLFVAKKT